MARVLAKHGIEQFVEFWLSKFRNDANIRRQRKYIEKAIKQLQFFLQRPCCDDPESVIEFRRLDNDLTRYIAAQLANKLDRRKWKKSLERALNALEARFNGCCGEPILPQINYVLLEDDGAVNPLLAFQNVSVFQGLPPTNVNVTFESIGYVFGNPDTVNIRVSANNTNCSFFTILKDGIPAVEGDDYELVEMGDAGIVEVNLIIAGSMTATFTINATAAADGATC